MSYLIDALKKAERDRHARQEANLRTAAATDAPARRWPGARLMVAVVAILVLANAVLLFRLWTPANQSGTAQATVSRASQVRPAEKSGPETVRHIVAGLDREQPASDPQQSRASAEASESRPIASDRRSHDDMSDNRDLGSLRLSTAPSTASAPDTRAAPQSRDHGSDHRSAVPQSAGDGSVRYADTRLSDDDPSPASGQTPDKTHTSASNGDENLPNQAQINGAPQIDINGQLYSSVPGRSFILIDGRRYHDGEKLPAGPAIERITASGATLRYRSKRYHVSGPGGG